MTYECITYEKKGKVGLITLTRPQSLNSINSKLLEELDAVLELAAGDPETGALAITGSGRFFCSGADLSSFLGASSTMDTYSYLKKAQNTISRLAGLPMATVAAVNGPALGGGFELCLACDFCLASEKASFGLPEINVGLLPGGGGMTRLPRFIGGHRTRQLVLSGERLSAGQAADLGLVYRVTPPEGLLEEALQLAASLAEKPPLGVSFAKEIINRAETMELPAAMDGEAKAVAVLFASEDCQEGLKAFFEKRAPVFRGK